MRARLLTLVTALWLLGACGGSAPQAGTARRAPGTRSTTATTKTTLQAITTTGALMTTKAVTATLFSYSDPPGGLEYRGCSSPPGNTASTCVYRGGNDLLSLTVGLFPHGRPVTAAVLES